MLLHILNTVLKTKTERKLPKKAASKEVAFFVLVPLINAQKTYIYSFRSF